MNNEVEVNYPNISRLNDPERILISAIWVRDGEKYSLQPSNIKEGYVVTGYRHGNAMKTIKILNPNFLDEFLINTSSMVFGFITNKERFLDRTEAIELARTYLDYILPIRTALYSDDLW